MIWSGILVVLRLHHYHGLDVGGALRYGPYSFLKVHQEAQLIAGQTVGIVSDLRPVAQLSLGLNMGST